jgi:adenosine/AMP kinase
VTYALAFMAYLIAVTLKAMQQRQVQHAEYRKMPLVSFGMAFCEIFILSMVVRHAENTQELVYLALAIGAGGSIGSILGTFLHARTLGR